METLPTSLRQIHQPVENLANLLYLIRKEYDRPSQVLEYTALAETQLDLLIGMVKDLYESNVINKIPE
jgi:hypothetical protein